MSRILCLLAIICLQVSCASSGYKHTVSSYRASAYHGLDRYYLALPIKVGKAEQEKGMIVCRGLLLYYLLYKSKYNEADFANYIFATLVKEETVALTETEYETVKAYTISKIDADKYKQMRLQKLLHRYSKDHFLPGIVTDVPDYQGRCIIYGFLSKGISVSIEDESGFLFIRKAH